MTTIGEQRRQAATLGASAALRNRRRARMGGRETLVSRPHPAASAASQPAEPSGQELHEQTQAAQRELDQLLYGDEITRLLHG